MRRDRSSAHIPIALALFLPTEHAAPPVRGSAPDGAGLMSRELSLQRQVLARTSDPPSSVVYVAPTDGGRVSRGDSGESASTSRDQLDRRVCLRRPVGG